MSDESKRGPKGDDRLEKGGYQPLNEGYTPGDLSRGYVPKVTDQQGVPPLPTGGSAQSPKSSDGDAK